MYFRTKKKQISTFALKKHVFSVQKKNVNVY